MNIWIVLGIVNIPVYYVYAWLIFENENVGDSFEAWAFMSNGLYSLRGGNGNPFLVWWWLGSCAGTVWLEHFLLMRYVFA